jgi:rhomboid protease GluP
MDDLTGTGENQLHEEKPSVKDRINNFFQAFKPRDGYYVTPIIIILNVAVFVIMVLTGSSVFDPDGEDLVNWGANYRPYTLNGEPWRLLTSCFIHIGIFHLILNMYALASIGILLEPLLGKRNFTIVYLLCGLLASTVSMWWHNNTVAAGASGAIFGVYGVFTALLTTNIISKEERQGQLQSMIAFIGYNLIFGLKGNIDNAAHIGGLLSGLLLGYICFFIISRKDDEKLVKKIWGGAVFLVVCIVTVMYFLVPNDIGVYLSKMETFSANEEAALTFYQLPDNASNEVIIASLDKGIVKWDESISLLKQLEDLDIEEGMHKRNKLLSEYAELRLKSFKLIKRSLTENSNQYEEELKGFYARIQELINELDKK